MKEKPLVSIIIPVYNGTNYMREAIDSALSQTYRNCEVIVVNDGSTDDGETENVALSYGDKIRYFYKENGGVATAVNYGIDMMRGEYFAWLSHDDKFYEDKIELQIDAICDSGDNRTICHGNFDFLEMETNEKTPVDWLTIYEKSQLEDSCFAPIFLAVHGSTVLIHRSHFERVGKYRTDLLATQDSEFLFRVMRGQKSVFVEKPLIIGRLHAEQGQKTMKCHKPEYNKMFVDFCNNLTSEEKAEFCGSELNFYYNLYALLKQSKPADSILDYLKTKIAEGRTVRRNHSYEKDITAMWRALLNRPVPINAQIYLFGAGYYGTVMKEKLESYGIKPFAFVDNSKQKHESFVSGLPIIPPSAIDSAYDRVIVIITVSQHVDDIREQLESQGIKNILSYRQVNAYLFKLLPIKKQIMED